MLVNLTPHRIDVKLPDGKVRAYAPSGFVARIDADELELPSVDGIPCRRRKLGACHIPRLAEGQMGIVSSLVLEAAQASGHPYRNRLLVPDTGTTAIREDGQVIAVTRLVR